MFRRFRPGRARARRTRSVRPSRSYSRKPLFELLEDRRLLAAESEPNNSIATANVLGSPPYVLVTGAAISIPGDQDFYRYTAHHTGKLSVRSIFFDVPSDGVGDLDLQVQDAFGNIIASSISVDSDELIIIPVVTQQTYYVRVFGAGLQTNTYDLEIENFAAPAPSFIDLTAASDTGTSNTDNVTSDTTPTFLIQADLSSFASMGITLLNQGTIDPDNNGIASDATDDGAGVYVSLINLSTGAQVQGFANQLGGTGILWTYTVPAASALTPGDWFASAAVQIVDGQDTSAAAGVQRATGRAQLSPPLIITIDSGGAVANMVSIDMISSSDTGMFNNDNVTSKMQPAFNGIAPVGSIVRLYVIPNGQVARQLVGQTVTGSDSSDVGIGGINGIGGLANDGLGLWEITIQPLADNGYDIRLEIEDAAGNVTQLDPMLNAGLVPIPIDFVIDTVEPNTAYLDLIDDTGRHNADNITKDNTPRVTMTTTDPNINLAQLLYTDNLKFRIYDRYQNNAEFLLYDSALDAAVDMMNTPGDMFTALTFIIETLPEQFFTLFGGGANPAVIGAGVLADGIHNLKLEVEDRAGNISHDFLLSIVVDTTAPPGSFGLPSAISTVDGLAASSDSGVAAIPATYADRITNDTTPTFWGRAEANSIVRVYLDNPNAGTFGLIDLNTDIFLGLAVAVPYDGNDAYPNGYWEITSSLDLNQIPGFTRDGLRQLLLTAEDVAGNPMPIFVGDLPVLPSTDVLQIFIDTQGPQVEDVSITGYPYYDLFDPKPSVNGYTPLVYSLTLDFIDWPARLANDFLYNAVSTHNLFNPVNYQVVGDHVGHVTISSVLLVSSTVLDGEPARISVSLQFATPLPDDRYTITILDNLVDPAGNKLDGESSAIQPTDTPYFPSGDGTPGGNFVARFTIDSRPEIGSWVAQNINIDINGNFTWDPGVSIGSDASNVDISWTLPVQNANDTIGLGGFNVHDLLFAGKFRITNGNGGAPTLAGANGYRYFDQLAAYGNSAQLGAFRWIIDTNSDGVVTIGTDILTIQPALPNFNIAGAIPIAGNFDGNAANGDEIGLYYAGKWGLDLNRNFVIEANEVFTTNLLGYPIVGDFDGDGLDDLAVFNNNQFFFDLKSNGFGSWDRTFVWGFPGVLDKPIAADMDGDGIDDIGLWVPRASASQPDALSEWYFLISNDHARTKRVTGSVVTLNHAFTPVPFGFDVYAQFGNDKALPIVGNFDPPVTTRSVSQASIVMGDYNGNGKVDKADYAVWKAAYGTNDPAADGNGDGKVDAADYAVWRNHMGMSVSLGGGGLSGGSGGGSLAALMAEGEEDSVEAVSQSETVAAPYYLSTTSSIKQSTATATSSTSSADDESLLLVLASQPISNRDEALSEFGEAGLFFAEDSDDDGLAALGEAALTSAWQAWDKL